jgi:putative FmdB family regulatory protein
MPMYDYECTACGDFTTLRPMSEYRDPQPCPVCGEPSARAMRTAPAFSSVSSATRNAHATNERSADKPILLSDSGRKHGPGCGCCGGSGKRGRTVAKGKDGSKAFPTARPWMISH